MKVIDEYRLLPVEGEIGIEIEMEGTNLLVRTPCWRIEVDNSLRGSSAEFVLNQPVPRAEVEEVLRALDVALKQKGANLEPSERCGVHVHINVQQMSFTELLKFVCLYLLVEDVLVRWCGEDRVGNLFCLRSSDAEAIIHNIKQCALKGSFALMQKDIWRYSSINLFALSKYGSVEFRAMQTYNKFVEPIRQWVELLCMVKDKSQLFGSITSMLTMLSFGPEDFLKHIFGPYVRDLWYPEIEAGLFEASRRVQVIAYTPQHEKRPRPPRKKKTDNIVFFGNPPAPFDIAKIKLNMELMKHRDAVREADAIRFDEDVRLDDDF